MSATKTATEKMTMARIRERAELLGIQPGKMKKDELITAIQAAEGNYTCYGWSNQTCDQVYCCWREDCFKIKR